MAHRPEQVPGADIATVRAANLFEQLRGLVQAPLLDERGSFLFLSAREGVSVRHARASFWSGLTQESWEIFCSMICGPCGVGTSRSSQTSQETPG